MPFLRYCLIAFFFCNVLATQGLSETLKYHTLHLDDQEKILPWYTPLSNAFDNYLNKTWSWALAAPLDQHGLPISYLYCEWIPGNPPKADTSWENDVGEKIPNWVESARLYYQYSGDKSPLDYVKGFVDYSLIHGQTPSSHAWPNFPIGTSNAGDTEFRGFTGRWNTWDCHVDLAADIGWAMTRMYDMYEEQKYLDKAIHVADLLAEHITPGNSQESPWPYVINSRNGTRVSRYATSWDGALLLFDYLIEHDEGQVLIYENAREILKNWIFNFPI